MRYYECAEFSRYKETAKLLFEGKKYLESIIEGATVQGAVTLATRSFGRGTDFKVFDQRMLRCGGVHILLTFYPKEISELVQIMGRGSRQGDAGSFSMVMCIPAIVKALNGKVTARVSAHICADHIETASLNLWHISHTWHASHPCVNSKSSNGRAVRQPKSAQPRSRRTQLCTRSLRRYAMRLLRRRCRTSALKPLSAK